MREYIYCRVAIMLSTAVVFSGCAAKDTAGEKADEAVPGVEEVSFDTDDGWEIYGSYYASGTENAPCVLLLHMMPADRHSYDDFAPGLAGAGYDVLSIDLRGHGDSLYEDGDKRSFENFGDAEHQASVDDIAAAKAFLTEKGADTSRLAIVGASIGANLALVYAAGDGDVKTVILLSPGLDYRGVLTAPAMEDYDRPSLIAASEGDGYSANSCRELKGIAGDNAELNIYDGSEHGTNLFKSEPQLETEINAWIGTHI
ncbi:MAG: alpha/beta fold hydrolase [bacterium]|nr:alpha/beta fold hydrolase [bacterium]